MKIGGMLHKEKIGVDDLENAAKDLKFDEFSSTVPFNSFCPLDNSIDAGDRDVVEENNYIYFNNKTINIEEKIEELLNVKLVKEERIGFDWIQIDNRIPYTASNSMIKTLRGNLKRDNEMSLVQMKSRKRVVQGILIKEQEGTTMSREFDEFLQMYFSILKEQVEYIDQGKHKLGFSRFLNSKK